GVVFAQRVEAARVEDPALGLGVEESRERSRRRRAGERALVLLVAGALDSHERLAGLDLLVSKVMAGAGGTQSGSSVREAVRTFTSSRGETDRLLISFPKSALMAESTPESLSGSLVQREYRSSADRPRFVRMGNSVSR
ncbi:MAG TPA: hypothetical protein PK869_12805, partial [Candidatus Hydrogenedentes bacterium]|nr:hypothetical protein [Candidatus Hydrogenedentota bacterium]